MLAELQKYFEASSSGEVLQELGSLCRVFGLSGEDLFYKWEAFAMTHPGHSLELTPEHVQDFRKHIETSMKTTGSKVKAEPGDGTTFGTPVVPRTQLRKNIGRNQLDSMLDHATTTTTPRAGSSMKPVISTSVSTPSAQPKSSPSGPSFSFASATPSKPATTSSFAPAKPLSTAPQQQQSSLSSSRAKDALITPRPKASTFESRPDAGKVVETVNAHLSPAQPYSGVRSRVALASNVNPSSFKYRYMFEKLLDRSDALDRRIDEAAELMRHQYAIEELGDPSQDSQEDCVCVGRICPDLHATKLHDPADKSKTSIWLESSRLYGGGSRTELRFDAACTIRGSAAGDGGAGLFPGAIVGVRGRNVGGHYFNVTELLMMPPIYPPETDPHKLLDYQYGPNNLDGRPMSIILASGPFTTEDNLDYAPFEALIDEARRSKPDVLILMGPFVDANHPLIKTGDLLATPKQIFREHMSGRLAGLFQSSPATTAILIPSLSDILSRQIVYPQSPLDKDPELGLPKGAKFLPNPVIFSVNEVVFAITSADPLFPLRTLEYVKEAPFSDPAEAKEAEGQPRDNISRICRHLLRQRSFYPIFPAPLAGGGMDGVNLDITHLDLLKFDDVSADVVVTPSKLGGQFIKIVDSACLVNPSCVTKGPNGGMFARFTIHPSDRKELEAEAGKAGGDPAEMHTVVDHKVWERARIELIKV